MKALVIAPQPFFSPRGTPLSVYYRTLIASELGVEIDLLTYGEGEDVDIPGIRIIRIPRFAILGNVKTGPSTLKLFLDLFLVLWAITLLVRNRYTFVHAHEEAVFFSRFLKPIFGFKLVYDMHSSLPQQLTNFQFTKSRFLIGLFKRLEENSLKAADAVITICPDLAAYAVELLDLKEKHILIENSIIDPIRLKKKPSGADPPFPLQEEFGKPPDPPPGKCWVVYAGTLESYQGVDILIQAFSTVVKKNPNAYLLIVGGTCKQVDDYSAQAAGIGLAQHTFFTGRVSRTLAQTYCRRASVLISPRCRGTNTPLKIYEQLASGIPLVATNIYSHTQVLNKKVAILVEPEPEDMARGILEALSSKRKKNRIVEEAKRLYEQKYSRTIYTDKMRHLLELLSS